jgi:hypothetical protein
MAAEVEQDIDSTTNGADDASVLDRENNQDGEHESEEIVDATVNEPTPRQRTRSQSKTRTFITPDAASRPSDDLEDEPSTCKDSISCIKARPKYLRSIQQLFPKSPRPRKAKKAAAAGGRG